MVGCLLGNAGQGIFVPQEPSGKVPAVQVWELKATKLQVFQILRSSDQCVQIRVHICTEEGG